MVERVPYFFRAVPPVGGVHYNMVCCLHCPVWDCLNERKSVFEASAVFLHRASGCVCPPMG